MSRTCRSGPTWSQTKGFFCLNSQQRRDFLAERVLKAAAGAHLSSEDWGLEPQKQDTSGSGVGGLAERCGKVFFCLVLGSSPTTVRVGSAMGHCQSGDQERPGDGAVSTDGAVGLCALQGVGPDGL